MQRTKSILLALSLFVFTFCQSCQKQEIQIQTQSPLELLLEGNRRFQANHPLHPDQTLKRLRELKSGQHPFATVVSCSDSRVPPELIFDQGLGDLFVIRTAGNVIGDYEIGSIEYAVEHLETPLIVVLGHENCGAVSAFIEHHHDHKKEHGHIQNIVQYLENEQEEQAYQDLEDIPIDLAVEANVKHGINLLKSSEPLLAEKIKEGKVKIIGAIYDFDDGSVRII